jgi:peptidoglycan/LPS O-acetylase OafA/YrhL
MNKKIRIEALTFLRFIAAVVVVFFHFGRETELARLMSPFILSGPQMVTFFFVLSGFVMMVSHYHKSNESLTDFYVARVARIMPIYLLALFIMAYYVYGYGNNDWLGLTLSATLLQSWFPPYPLSFNDPGWSLSVEAVFYLSFPMILLLVKKSQISWLKLLITALLCYLLTIAVLSNLILSGFNQGYQTASFDLLYYFPLSHLCSFILGVAGGYFYIKTHNKHNHESNWQWLYLALAFFLSYFFLQHTMLVYKLAGFALYDVPSFYALFFILLILAIAFSRNGLTKFLSLPVLVLLGESSYALYILQKPVHIMYKLYIADLVSLNKEYHFYLYLTLLIGLSLLSLYLIEKPAKILIFKLNKRLTKSS